MKFCTRCKQELPLMAFNKHKNSHDGLQSQCRKCMTARQRERRHEWIRKQSDPNGISELLRNWGRV